LLLLHHQLPRKCLRNKIAEPRRIVRSRAPIVRRLDMHLIVIQFCPSGVCRPKRSTLTSHKRTIELQSTPVLCDALGRQKG
jgi:hypothetical protein